MVDDNKDVVTEVKKYFSSKNVGVEIVGSCSNGEDALNELKRQLHEILKQIRDEQKSSEK